MTKDEALKLALEALKTIDEAMPFPVAKLAQAAIKEALAQPVPESSACCHACFKASGATLMTRMILCPTCGNKRCPRASDHRLECTDINEPGQTGSVYTATLPVQEPVAGKGKEYSEQLKLCARNLAFVSAGWVNMSSAAMQEMFALIDHVCAGIDSPPQPEERYFCQRCGKPVNLTTIHTCTPPQIDPNQWAFDNGLEST
jgi:hypothetical protein